MLLQIKQVLYVRFYILFFSGVARRSNNSYIHHSNFVFYTGLSLHYIWYFFLMTAAYQAHLSKINLLYKKIIRPIFNAKYNGPCDLRPPIQPAKYGLKLKVVLKQRDVYIENIRVVSLILGLKMQGIVKQRGLKSQGPLYNDHAYQ